MESGLEQRRYWLSLMLKIADPVLTALVAGRLKRDMPVQTHPGRAQFMCLEAFARIVVGMAPWLEHKAVDEDEERLRLHYGAMVREALAVGADPASPDYFNFDQGAQPLVECGLLAQGLFRAPNALWGELDNGVKKRVLTALKKSRKIKPVMNNWLLFSAMVEAFFYKCGQEWDPMRIDYALKQFEQWYLGDGIYGDGFEFHWDYYNSAVIHPMLLDTLNTVHTYAGDWLKLHPLVVQRAQRYAVILEHLISPEGAFPPIGRSLSGRLSAMHLLGQMALQHRLPDELHPAQVRYALTAVIRRMMEMPGTFDDNGWLKVGFCGHQPKVAENYISTGSLYLCMLGLLPLGLPADDEFWAAENRDWTAKKMWSGDPDANIDHALRGASIPMNELRNS